MTTWIEPEAWLSRRERASLARGLDVLDSHTEAPLRIRGHSARREHDVFEIQEEFELGPRGRRYLLSVDGLRHETFLLALGIAPGVSR